MYVWNVFRGGKFGLVTPIQFLMGLRNKKLVERVGDLFSHPLYGAGRHHNEKWWKAFAQMVLDAGYVEEYVHKLAGSVRSISVTLARLSILGLRFAHGNEDEFWRQPSPDIVAIENAAEKLEREQAEAEAEQSRRSAQQQAITDPSSAALFEHLRKIRRETAEAKSLPPYRIFSDQSLAAMAELRPTSLHAFRSVLGVNDYKAAQYSHWVSIISAFCKSNNLPTDLAQHALSSSSPPIVHIDGVRMGHLTSLPYSPLSSTVAASYQQYHQGLSIEDIATARSLSPSTVAGHLVQALGQSHPVDLSRMFLHPPRIFALAAAVDAGTHSASLKALVQSVPLASYTEARLAMILSAAPELRSILEDLSNPVSSSSSSSSASSPSTSAAFSEFII